MANTKKPTPTLSDQNVETQSSDVKPSTENQKQAQVKKRPTIVSVPLTDLVCVKSCFYGNLIYKSRKSGSIVEWNDFDSEQYMSVEELLTMRNTQPTFFKEPWVRVVGDNADDVSSFLQLNRYCKNVLPFEELNELFELSASELKDTVSALTPSMQESIARYAIEKINNGTFDELKKIRAIEDATGFDLME